MSPSIGGPLTDAANLARITLLSSAVLPLAAEVRTYRKLVAAYGTHHNRLAEALLRLLRSTTDPQTRLALAAEAVTVARRCHEPDLLFWALVAHWRALLAVGDAADASRCRLEAAALAHPGVHVSFGCSLKGRCYAERDLPDLG
ncbi:MAG: hypothetical protein HOV71_18070 [Hamadaea sp.]|nr:hypothetical protein [Hamadaea sp.]